MQVIIARLIGSVLINMVLVGLVYLIKKKNDKISIENVEKEQVTVRLPGAYLWLGCISIIMSVLLFFLVKSRFELEFILKCIVTAIFFFLGVLLFVGTLIWRIDIYTNNDFFLYRTVIGRKYKILYSDCKFYSCDNNMLKLKTKRKKFYIDTKSVNFQYFYEMLEENNVASIENSDSDKIIVKMSKGNFVAACFCLLFSILFLVYMLLFPNETANFFTYFIASVFILLSILLTMYTLMWKIEMINDKNYFVYKTTFGRTYVINYSDCNFPDKISNLFKLSTPKRTFYIDTKAKNFEIFIMTLKISKAIKKN